VDRDQEALSARGRSSSIVLYLLRKIGGTLGVGCGVTWLRAI
jgi:hypothetical protein